MINAATRIIIPLYGAAFDVSHPKATAYLPLLVRLIYLEMVRIC